MTKQQRGFASDNNSGVHQQVMEAIISANMGHAIGYGGDPWTAKAMACFHSHFGADAQTFLVWNGTGANVLAIQSLLRSYQSVICAETAHIHVDECGAPEKHSGCKLLAIPTPDGKLTPELVKPYLIGFGFEHHSQPGIISITQSTEMGTVYMVSEIQALADLAHAHQMYLHMDGARLSNAAASLGKSLHEVSLGAGVDVLSMGGTKNGLMFGEAVVFAPHLPVDAVKYMRKQTTQLNSKMRFAAAQFIALLEDDLWLKNALHANKMAKKLENALASVRQVKITQKVEANGIFAIVPPHWIAPLQKQFFFYVWNAALSEVRWMTSFDTTEQDIETFIQFLHNQDIE